MSTRYFEFSGFLLPLPEHWSLIPGQQSYSGDEGLLDPRIVVKVSPIDASRVAIAKEELREDDVLVSVKKSQGRTLMLCKYKKDGCTVLAYSIEGDGDTEIRVVYVIRPSFEYLTEEIERAL